MYKQSLYNVFVEKTKENKNLIYNTYSGSFACFDNQTQQIFDDIEYISKNDNLDSQTKEIIDNLFQLGFIVDNKRNEDEELKLQGRLMRFANNQINLTIAPTLNCNMRCPYCYEEKKNINMNELIENDIVKFVKKMYEDRKFKYMSITWYGGEPLLSVDTIFRLSEKFILFCNEKGIKYDAGMISNGVLLTYDLGRRLKEECHLSFVQVTIDGMPDYHNKKRCLIDGRESFPIIVNNVDACKDLFKIAVRVNVDEINKDNVQKLVDYLIDEKKWGENPFIYYAPVREYDTNKQTTKCLSTKEYINKEMQLTEKCMNINSKVKEYLYPKIRVMGCGSISIGSYVIDPLGNLYPCFNVIGNIEESIGNVHSYGKKNSNYIKWYVTEPDEKCYTCKLFPICGGGCPYDQLRYSKSTCDKTILSVQNRLKVLYEEHVQS